MLKGLFIGAALLVLSARPAAAQDFSGGYALVNWGGCCAHGFMIDYAHPVFKRGHFNIEGVADFGWTRFGEPDNETDTTFAGGARFKVLPQAPVPIYGQFMLGAVHWSEDAGAGFAAFTGTDFIIGFGAGTIIKATEMFGIKPQVDWFYDTHDDVTNHWSFRFTINAVFKIGK